MFVGYRHDSTVIQSKWWSSTSGLSGGLQIAEMRSLLAVRQCSDKTAIQEKLCLSTEKKLLGRGPYEVCGELFGLNREIWRYGWTVDDSGLVCMTALQHDCLIYEFY